MVDTAAITSDTTAIVSLSGAMDLREQKLDEIAARIRMLSNHTALQFSIDVGHMVIEEFYGGNIRRWRVRGVKDTSLRRLAQHPSLPISATTLYRSIAIYELSLRVGSLSRWPGLGPSQLRAIVRLDPEEQELMMDEAEQNRWSAQKVHDTVAARLSARRRGGRRAMHKLLVAVRTIRRSIRTGAHLLSKRSLHETLDDASAELIRSELNSIKNEMERVAELLSIPQLVCSPQETMSG